MKKYLIVGAWALVAGLFVTSCTHDDDIYNGSVVEQKQEAFQKAFVSAFGQINSNQNWGFNDEDLTKLLPSHGIAAGTRTVDTNSNEWVQKGYSVPGAITQREYDVVMKWFRENKNPTSETINIKNYFMQNVGFTAVEYTTSDGHKVVGADHMDWIFCGPGRYDAGNGNYVEYNWNNGDEHTNNFNANSGEIQHILYSGSEWFGYFESFNTTGGTAGHGDRKYCQKNRNFVIRFISVDGVVGCYVGFDYECHGQQGELEPDGYFSDRVIKLIPDQGGMSGLTEIDYRKEVDEVYGENARIFCEDLGDVSYNDIDYNDVVFDAQIIIRETQWYMDTYPVGKEHKKENRIASKAINDGAHPYSLKHYAKIRLLAAGGTMPVTVAGREVHNEFGVGHTTMVNTVTSKTGTLNGAPYVQREYVEMGEFEGYKNVADIPIVVQHSGGVIELTAIPGKAPHKIKVSAPYEKNGVSYPGTDWTSERCNLGDAYPDFKEYVAKPKIDDESGEFEYDENGNLVFSDEGKTFSGASFWDNFDSAYLFGSLQPVSCGEARGTVTTTVTSEGVTEILLYTNDDGYDLGSPLYFMNRELLKNLGIKANDVIRIYGEIKDEDNSDWHISLNDGNSKNLHRVGAGNEGTWKGYVDIFLTADMVTTLTTNIDNCAMILSGTNIKVTRVSLIKN